MPTVVKTDLIHSFTTFYYASLRWLTQIMARIIRIRISAKECLQSTINYPSLLFSLRLLTMNFSVIQNNDDEVVITQAIKFIPIKRRHGVED